MYKNGNNDGFGLAYVEGDRNKDGDLIRPGRIKKVKSMGNSDELAKLYEEHMDKNLVMHFRNATMGDKIIENCHPYDVLSIDEGHSIDLVMFHNGTIRDIQIEKKMSDSWNFTQILRGVLAERPSMLYTSSFRYMLCTMLGFNKLVFLDNRERVVVINYDLGSIHEPTGVWVSNKSEMRLPVKTAPLALMSPPKSPQLGAGENTVTEGSGKKVTWREASGKWVMDADSRSHFIPSHVSPAKKEKKAKVVSRERNLWPPDDLEIDKLIKDAKIQSQDLEEFEKALNSCDQFAIHAFVEEFPVEAAFTFLKVAERKSVFPEFVEKPAKESVKMATEEPWKMVFALMTTLRQGQIDDKESSKKKEKAKILEVN